eukprot:350120-Chlamydomonas_euryale.AAC.1
MQHTRMPVYARPIIPPIDSTTPPLIPSCTPHPTPLPQCVFCRSAATLCHSVCSAIVCILPPCRHTLRQSGTLP